MSTTLLFLFSQILISSLGHLLLIPAAVLFIMMIALVVLYNIRKGIGRARLIQMITETEVAKGSSSMIKTSFYSDGHPDLDKPVNYCVITRAERILYIGVLDELQGRILELGEIPISKIINIKVQDINSLKFKATESWKLSKKMFSNLNETQSSRMAILTIEWIKGEEKFETRFGIHEEDAMINALIKRNEIFAWFKAEVGISA